MTANVRKDALYSMSLYEKVGSKSLWQSFHVVSKYLDHYICSSYNHAPPWSEKVVPIAEFVFFEQTVSFFFRFFFSFFLPQKNELQEENELRWSECQRKCLWKKKTSLFMTFQEIYGSGFEFRGGAKQYE